MADAHPELAEALRRAAVEAGVTTGSTEATCRGVPEKMRWSWFTPTPPGSKYDSTDPPAGRFRTSSDGSVGSSDWPRAGDTDLADRDQPREEHDRQQHRSRHAPTPAEQTRRPHVFDAVPAEAYQPETVEDDQHAREPHRDRGDQGSRSPVAASGSAATL